jgi:hypothetical protein
MANKMPRVPEASRSPKGHPPVVKQDTRKKAEPENPAEQGETGNIRQNTQSRQKNR